MKVEKRDGRIVDFCEEKIIDAMIKAYDAVHKDEEVTEESAYDAEEYVNFCYSIAELVQNKYSDIASVETIQDDIEKSLLDSNYKDIAKAYILYRQKRTDARKNTIDDVVEEIISNSSKYWTEENSNKDAQLNTTMRDYIAGAVSTDMMRRKILSKELIDAHDKGIIHIHDMDYVSMPLTNCCLINLEDMLQNGTVISKTKIDKPHKFSTACNIATQVVAQVASSQFGGQSITLSHLSPFVEESRKTFKSKYPKADDALIEQMVDEDITSGIQTLQYQILTLMTTNGQAPFITVYMNLAEVPEGKEREDLAKVIHECIEQRYKGVKNEKGVYISPAFPKLIYALDECNIDKDSKYFWLTKESAKCSVKRLVPDYMSNKIERELKDGDIFPSMGCVEGKSVIRYKLNDTEYTESFEKAYNRLLQSGFTEKTQDNGIDKYIDVNIMSIYDNGIDDFTKCYRVIKNRSSKWIDVMFSNGRTIKVTDDHVFTLKDGVDKYAKDLSINDEILNLSPINESSKNKEYCKIVKLVDINEEGYSYDVTTKSEHFMVNGIYSHNCRSMLAVDSSTENVAKETESTYEKHKGHKYYGRFNQGVCTLNLVDVALSANHDINKFWKLMEERSELVHKALKIRHKTLLGTLSNVAPILWQNGAYARLNKNEKIDRLLESDYSTISFGYGGLYETCMALIGESNTTEKGKQLSIDILKFMSNKCDQWKAEENIGYSLYGSPMESTTYKFAKCLKKRFGVIKEVTDYDYITNSFHVNVREPIDAFTKLKLESEFQKYSLGGQISYVELPQMSNNIDAVVQLLQFMYDNIFYAELNVKSDYCQKCGYDGEIKVKGEEGHLYWECPNCGCTDKSKLTVTRRTCGYIGSNFWNQGRTEEIKDRVLHLDGDGKSDEL